MLILRGMEHLSGAMRHLPLPWYIGEQHETGRFLVFTQDQRSLCVQGRPQPIGQRFDRTGLVPTRPPRALLGTCCHDHLSLVIRAGQGAQLLGRGFGIRTADRRLLGYSAHGRL
jgi:hypothetical protein